MEVEFTVAGVRKSLRSEMVVRRLKDVNPGPIGSHAVEIGGVLYPVKEAFALVTELDLLDFNTNQARNVFKRLGFKVSRVR